MPAKSFPTLSINCLWHVGSMNPADKRPGSYEGAGLSVSLHPDEWTHIAKLGGYPTWELRRDGATFLHAHRLTKAQKSLVMAWGIERGLAEVCDLWEWSRFDDELESTITSYSTSEDEAREEADDGDGGVWGSIKRVDGHRSTALLADLARQHGPIEGSDFVLDLLYPLYAEQKLDVDGVWWADKLQPECYSAPRGVIILSKLSLWSVAPAGVEQDAA
jgi:hypothetical protein